MRDQSEFGHVHVVDLVVILIEKYEFEVCRHDQVQLLSVNTKETYPKPLAESDCADEFCITQNFQKWNRFFYLGILPDAEKMDLTKIPGDI